MEENKSASILNGLRMKFAREKANPKSYSSGELWFMIDEVIKKKIGILPIEQDYGKGKDWGVVNEQIERSKIKRYNWKKLFGNTLTEEILKLKKEGFHSENAYNHLITNQAVQQFLRFNPQEAENMKKNIKISVCARYAETDTAEKVLNE